MTISKKVLSSVSAAAAMIGLFGATPSASAHDGNDGASRGQKPQTIEAPGVDVIASYRGASINLTKDGWGDAQACAVYSPNDVRCFTASETEAYLGAAAWECAYGWVCLYEHRDGVGRRLIFNDEYWHDLGAYSFRNTASSWKNAQNGFDAAQLRDGGDPGGGGWQRQLGGTIIQENLDGNLNDSADEVHG
ncbi:peptidase inhibitor family I36 protein [Pendulispora albinea]|uniref:Peptidase inhibitor family I36 protein n=1 Tax=Pendulispora albinea TaxID=2741071 RepID=A0ABZ2LVQ1_9BACT